MTDHPSQHFVTITAGEPDEDGCYPEPQVKFECRDPEAKCHTYPACDCERWNDTHAAEYGEGHERVHHDRCWLQDWFDSDAACYAGEDANDTFDHGVPAGLNRTGRITVHFLDDYPEWGFAKEAPND